MKKITFLLSIILSVFLIACDSTDEELTSIELASPKPVVTTNLGSATITWPAIPKIAGYAYAIDNNTEYTFVDAETTTVTITDLSAGSHTFRVHAVGNLEHTTDSAERTIDFEIDPTLPAPQPSFVKEGNNVAIISWEAVEGAVGYAYKLNNEATWNTVSADMLSIRWEIKDTEAKNIFTLYAIGKLPGSDDSEETTLTIQLIDTSVGYWVHTDDGGIFELVEESTNHLSTTINCSGKNYFTILMNGSAYGFTSYSGNGGIGQVNDEHATLPYSYYPQANYYIRESVGRMAKETDSSNKFWLNVDEATIKVKVQVDLSNTDGIPRYKIELLDSDDSTLILSQYFDLFVYGGDWQQADKVSPSGRKLDTTDSETVDGTEIATSDASYTTFGMMISTDETANSAYITNRGLDGWDVTNCFEFPGYIRLSNSYTSTLGGDIYGILTTPKLTAITTSSTIKVTFGMLRFASTGDFPVKVLNAGTVSSASVDITSGGNITTIDPESDNKSIMITSTTCPKLGNGDFKPWSQYTMIITGATSETQIMWDTTGAGSKSNDGRTCLDNIVIRKY